MYDFCSGIICSFISFSGHAGAANYSEAINGSFKSVDGDAITVEVPSLVSKSTRVNDDKNASLSFQFNSNTVYVNFNELEDLRKGDPVKVEYKEGPNEKIKKMMATAITKLSVDSAVLSLNTNGADTSPDSTSTKTVTTVTTTKVTTNTE